MCNTTLITRRKPLINANDQGFFITDKNKSIKVTFIEFISEGGSCLVYRGFEDSDTSHNRAVVIKEYYPDSENIRFQVSFDRKKTKEGVFIIPLSADKKEGEKNVADEKEHISRMIKHELKMINELAAVENLPNLCDAHELKPSGKEFTDSNFIIIYATDINEGRTLNKEIKDKRYDLETTINKTKLLLDITNRLHTLGYIHCDIKPSNIWITGKETDENFYLLDLGSVLKKSDFAVEEVNKRIEELLENTSIGTSTEYYSSKQMKLLSFAKSIYFQDTDKTSFTKNELFKAYKNVDEKTDIYSVLKCMFFMLTGKDDSDDMKEDLRKVGIIGEISNHIIKVLTKSGNLKYNSIYEVKEDLDILDTLRKGHVHPSVLIDKLTKEGKMPVDCDDDLLPDVEIL